jgi:transcriptional regulator with XRE-family HTH domain
MFRLRIKEAANEKGFGQNKLARRADVDVKTVQRIFRNPYAEISTYTLDKIATALDVDPRTLIEPEEKNPQEGTRSD